SVGTGGIGISTFDAITEQQQLLLKRFRNVFELAYTRFLDLQKAQAQAREAQIEAALERVRVVAMGMIKDDDIRMVCEALYKELKHLGFKNIRNAQGGIIDAGNKTFKEYSYSDYGSSTTGVITKYTDDPLSFELVTEIQQSKDAFFKKQISGDEFERWRRWRLESGRPDDPLLEQASSTWFYIYSIGTGGIGISTLDAITEPQQLLLKRFKNVFELTYTRFHDLQKAEAQAKEAQIEAALERVRASAMAMHKSEDLHGAVKIMFEEFQKLNLDVLRCGVGILNKDSRTGSVWATSVSDSGRAIQISANESFDTHPLMMLIYQSWQKQEDLSYVLQGQDLSDYYKAMDASELKLPKSQILFSEDQLKPQYYYAAMFNAGGLYSFADKPFAPEDIKIMKRFASVVNLTYNRFLDLQKAEAQTREAQIELAVERVRAKALAMYKSEDLHSVVVTLKKVLTGLRIPNITAATIYLAQNDGSIRILDLSDTGEEDDDKPQLQLDKIFRLEETDPDLWIRRMWNRSENYFVLEADEADFVRVIQWIRTADPAGAEIAEKIIREKSIKKAWLPTVKLEKGILNIDLLEPPTDEIKPILLKMGAGFDLAYKRFLDLQKAESQAKESQIELGLERVRAQAMAMHSSQDLMVSAALLFKELKKLGLSPISCGYSIVDDKEGICIQYEFNEDGSMNQNPWSMSLTETKVLRKRFESWKRKDPLNIEELEGEENIQHHRYVAEKTTNFPLSAEQLLSGIPDHVVFYTINFAQGYLIIITGEKLSAEMEKIAVRFGKV
ncbi:MAG TPA: hypothetical protein VNA26_05410, partial [Chitinophagaceae bacterium]|nr:hypothetical protein [Chitinophagaceae bacterium]